MRSSHPARRQGHQELEQAVGRVEEIEDPEIAAVRETLADLSAQTEAEVAEDAQGQQEQAAEQHEPQKVPDDRPGQIEIAGEPDRRGPGQHQWHDQARPGGQTRSQPGTLAAAGQSQDERAKLQARQRYQQHAQHGAAIDQIGQGGAQGQCARKDHERAPARRRAPASSAGCDRSAAGPPGPRGRRGTSTRRASSKMKAITGQIASTPPISSKVSRVSPRISKPLPTRPPPGPA